MKTMNLARALFAGLLSTIVRTVPRLILVAALACTTGMFTASAHAATTLAHTWVASNGSDANNCDRPTPCASFSGAYNKTTTGGEITCADSGNFGGLGISKSLTVNCESNIGNNSLDGGVSFMTINGTSVTVILRGLDLDGIDETNNVPCSGIGASVNFTGSGTQTTAKTALRRAPQARTSCWSSTRLKCREIFTALWPVAAPPPSWLAIPPSPATPLPGCSRSMVASCSRTATIVWTETTGITALSPDRLH
jgi:hypothetical protein